MLTSLFLFFSNDPVGGAAVSRLVIPRADKSDSGVYTCSLSKFSSVLVHVHILNGKVYSVSNRFLSFIQLIYSFSNTC